MERETEGPAERLEDMEPEERLVEELRVADWEEDDRDVVEDPPERRVCASASGAAIIAIVTSSAATVLIILLIALSFFEVSDINGTFRKGP